MEQQEVSLTAGGNAENATMREGILAVSYKTEHIFPYHATIALLGIYPNEMKTYIHTNFSQIFITALFIITKTWIQPRCPSACDG